MYPAMYVSTLKASAAVASTADGTALDLSDYEGNVTVIMQSTASGSGITNTISIIDCATSGGSYSAISGAAFTAVDNTGAVMQSLVLNTDEINRFIKPRFTVAGGSGSGVVSMTVVGYKKYK